ncbi:HypC/HybG/HupF family hydrogenase formation chaperone [Marinospirillum sp.]|uniref:HypC/HybG/HupF family hydrogenase formation chaperone n=1 Tax=Marinospirillum sp. TaxID=2183934 RepID=UPI0028709DDC|nr:HypC/HybG/HupF family hydrogenase formation chaperone [Marinospirillum sp.]MDR9468647.1 HypC/HybG/HupF family hydrogenase formation chaperone [Marinospirillum sp.]
MCIGYPLQVVEVEEERALCQRVDQNAWVDTRLVEACQPGDWLLVFHGAAREKLTPERASQVNQALAALVAAEQGDHQAIDELFADLVDREPQLPPHLQQ